MIASTNPVPHEEEFLALLASTTETLNVHARNWPQKVETLRGSKLEPYVRDLMAELAVGTIFEDSIELIGGQKFPDIIAKKFYGIEIKTTTKNHWKTTGNSVLESTRIEDVKRIFMLFGKLAHPIEFRYRKYEECLSEVVVTHSPRYLIDMNLEIGKTIFDKIQMPYDSLRQAPSPIKPITDYYKQNLKPGQDLWWIDQEEEKASNLVIDLWSNLETKRKEEIIVQAMAFYPELFGNQSDKFARFAIWLISSEAIVCPNIRDLFTAGGRAIFNLKGRPMGPFPRAFINLFDRIEGVKGVLSHTPVEELSTYWKTETTEENKILDWVYLVSAKAETLVGEKHLEIREILRELIK